MLRRVTSSIRVLLMLVAPLPALVVGVLLMRRIDVSPGIWGQQLAAGLTLMAFCAGARIALPTTPRSGPQVWAIVGSACLLLLVATLFHSGVDGVRRWVALGPLQLHAAFIALPILILVFGGIVRRDDFRSATWILPCALVAAAGVLVLQPDVSQASAFAVAVAVVLFHRRQASTSDWVAAGVVAGCAVLAFSRPDPLDGVPHVEGIVWLAASAGTAWLVAAVLALALLPLPFLANAAIDPDRAREGLALAAYFVVVCIASSLAAYPVPILGYGLSPILGYYAALAWIMRPHAA